MTIARLFPLLIFVWMLAPPLPAQAVEPSEMLEDPVLEERARDISAGLRCVVCQNQSIDDSNAQLAKDMRILVRDRLLEGDTNEQVIDYVVSRYGDFVLLEPPMKASTYALWFGPVVIAVLALFAFIAVFRKHRANASPIGPQTPAGLNEEEEKRIRTLLNETDDATGGKS